MRILFFAGKGGVGKTSLSAATGIKAAEIGHRTVILSLDVAHSLADIFDLEQCLLDQNKGRPVPVAPNLDIQELDIQEEIRTNWGDIYKYLAILLNTTGLDEILAEELAILPGMEEISLLLYINRYARDKAYDVIILDCAPTGESIRFISIPTTLEWYMKKLFRLERTVARYARPIARRVTDIPIPGDDYFVAIESLFKRPRGVDKLLTDPDITTVRLVTNPEKIVIKETQRAFMYFSLYKMSIDAIIINRILPASLREDYFRDWIEGQRQHIENAKEFFSPVPILAIHQRREEIFGYDRLKDLAEGLYQDRQPLDRLFHDPPFDLSKTDGQYQLTLKLPFAEKADVELNRVADELICRVGAFKRHILLPRGLAGLDVISAKLDGDLLRITFEGDRHDG